MTEHTHVEGCICALDTKTLEEVRVKRDEMLKAYDSLKVRLKAVRPLGALHAELQAKIDETDKSMESGLVALGRIDKLILKLEAERN